MARTIELQELAFVVRYRGLGALLRMTGELRVPYSNIRSVRVGVESLPGALAWRVGLNTWVTDTRRGIFWVGGKRLFLDLADRRRAVVLELEGHTYDHVAIEPDTDPEHLAEQLRARLEPRPQGATATTLP